MRYCTVLYSVPGRGKFRGGIFPRGKFRISIWCGIFPVRNFFSNTQSCSICVLRRKNRMLTKQTHMVEFNSSTIQTYAESLLVALLYCVSFGDRNTRIPFVCNALKIWEVRNFPLDFWDRCGIFPVRNFPLRKNPRTEFSPRRYLGKCLTVGPAGEGACSFGPQLLVQYSIVQCSAKQCIIAA